jgi:hypothetical protein
MMQDLPVEGEDPTIICQIDFVNAFQTPSCQLGTNDPAGHSLTHI